MEIAVGQHVPLSGRRDGHSEVTTWDKVTRFLYTLNVIYVQEYILAMDAFVAIAEPSRRRILELLASGEHSAGDIVAALPQLTQPAVSRHLRVLRESGLIGVRADAQRRIYGLEPAGLAVVEAWLARYRTFWNDHLASLEAHLVEDTSK